MNPEMPEGEPQSITIAGREFVSTETDRGTILRCYSEEGGTVDIYKSSSGKYRVDCYWGDSSGAPDKSADGFDSFDSAGDFVQQEFFDDERFVDRIKKRKEDSIIVGDKQLFFKSRKSGRHSGEQELFLKYAGGEVVVVGGFEEVYFATPDERRIKLTFTADDSDESIKQRIAEEIADWGKKK